MTRLALLVGAAGIVLIATPVCLVSAATLVALSPVLALGAALGTAWAQSQGFRWICFGVLLGLAVYGAASAGAMVRGVVSR